MPLNYWIRAAVVGIALHTAHAPFSRADSTNDELAKKVEALEREVRELRAAKAADPGSNPALNRQAVDATVKAVLADASRHELGFPTGGSSGHDLDKGFFIKSDEGRFSLYPDLLLQFRGVANYREGVKQSGGSSTESGFEVRRGKIGFYGTAFSPDLSYRFLWQDTVTGGGLNLQYAFAQYIFLKDLPNKGELAVRAGQFKNPVFKEEFTGDRAQLLAERSLANALLGGASIGSETQGVDLILTGRENPLHVDLLIDDGIKSSNTDFRDNQPVTNATTGVTTNVATNFGAAVRVDYKLFGRWGDADDLTGVWGREDLLVVGGGVDFSQGDGNSTYHWTADVQYQWQRKLSLLAAVYGDHVDFRNDAGNGSRDDWGFQVEGGYFVTANWQLIARYALVKLDSSFKTGGEDTFHEIAGGFNYYFGEGGVLGNRAKFTLDVNYLPSGTPAAAGLDYLASPNKKDEIVIRTQLQFSL